MKKQRKPLVEQTPHVHVRALRDAGITPAEDIAVIRVGTAPAENIHILWRAANLGGMRAYFVCPCCDAGTMILYAAPHLACRKCQGLAYRVENLTPLWRKNEKLHKLQKRAGIDVSRWPRPIPPKPKWQRWHTHLNLRRQINEADHDFAAAWMNSLCARGMLR